MAPAILNAINYNYIIPHNKFDYAPQDEAHDEIDTWKQHYNHV